MAGLFNAAEGRRPAFFEMYAQERLIPMLRPAVKHVIAVFAERNVRLLPIHNNADDIITLGLCVLEGHYLRKHAATFAENFYGLQRTSAFGRVGMTLTLWQRICALMWTVLLPAAKEKLDRSYTNQVEAANASGWQNTNQVPGNNTQLATNSTWASIQSRLLPLFVQWYPVAHALFEGTVFIYRLRYMFEHSPYFSPFLHAQGQVVQRLSPQDMLRNSHSSLREQLQWKIRNSEMGPLMRAFQAAQQIVKLGLDSFKYMLLASVFGFRFLDWWYSSETSESIKPKVIAVPPPAFAQWRTPVGFNCLRIGPFVDYATNREPMHQLPPQDLYFAIPASLLILNSTNAAQ